MSRFFKFALLIVAILAFASIGWAQMDGPGPGGDGGFGGPPPGGKGGHGGEPPEGGPGMGGPPPGEGMFGPGGHSLLSLLRIEKVQKELNLTDEQKQSIKKLSQEMRPQRPGKPGERPSDESSKERPSGDEMRKKMDERMQKVEKKLADILKSEQLHRLQQIQLQVSGVSALAKTEVVNALELSDSQQTKIATINDKLRQQMRKLSRPGRDHSRGHDARHGNMEKQQKLQKDAMTKALAVLTADQRQKFQEMLGKTFELDQADFGGRHGGGDRPEPPQRNEEGGW